MVEKSDEFDECVLNRQNFPSKILHLENIGIVYFTVIINFTDLIGFVTFSGHGILKYFHITHKKDAPEDKDPPQ